MTRHNPLVRAYVSRDVCLVNPFRCKIMHKKASFELLTDDAHQSWFTLQKQKDRILAYRFRGRGACVIATLPIRARTWNCWSLSGENAPNS